MGAVSPYRVMALDNSTAPVESPQASWIEIPDRPVVSIEHPGVIRDVENAIASLGGNAQLGHFMTSEVLERSLLLRLTGADPFRKTIASHAARTANIVLKITIPKPTGRKRKRGSSGPFNYEGANAECPLNVSSTNILRALKDNAKTAKLQPFGLVHETHRFRDLPDFQYSLAQSPLSQNLSHSVLQLHYQSLKKFALDTQTKGVQSQMDMIPPPSFSQTNIHFNYAYHQNPSVKFLHDESGKQTSVNTSLAPKIATQMCSFDVISVPSRPEPGVAPEHSLEPGLQNLLVKVRQLFDERPICTRRALLNHLGRDAEHDLKGIMQYAGFMLRSGPWKDAYIKFGVDPRTNPEFRIYQTISFQIVVKDDSKEWLDGRVKWSRSSRDKQGNNRSHVFDGKSLTADGKVWQVCDVVNPLLRSMLDGDSVRLSCDIKRDGWYNNGTWAKFRVIMRDMIGLIISGQTPDDTDYMRLSKLPNIIDESNVHMAIIAENCTTKEQLLAVQVRSIAKTGEKQDRRTDRPKFGSRQEAMVEEEAWEDVDKQQEEDAHGAAATMDDYVHKSLLASDADPIT